MPVHTKCKLVKAEKLKEDIFKFSVESKEIAEIAKPRTISWDKSNKDVEPLLRRPISIYNIEGNIIEFVFQVKGKGTEILSKREEGSYIDILRTSRKWTIQIWK